MSIQFIESGRTVGYQARVWRAGVGQSRFFAVKKYGKREALALAREAEGAMRRAFASKSAARNIENKNNTSGLVGIGLRAVGAEGVIYITSSWREDGHARATSYSIARHGRIRATELALRAREAGTGVRYGVTARKAWLLMSARLR